MTDVRVRAADPSERAAVANVLDGAALAIDDAVLEAALGSERVLVALSGGDPGSKTVLGALVLDGQEIVAVAVRPGRRDQGIGRALVEAAADRRDRLIVECDADVRPFWSSLGFAMEPTAAGRYRGVR